jgi:hypothetical protein
MKPSFKYPFWYLLAFCFSYQISASQQRPYPAIYCDSPFTILIDSLDIKEEQRKPALTYSRYEQLIRNSFFEDQIQSEWLEDVYLNSDLEHFLDNFYDHSHHHRESTGVYPLDLRGHPISGIDTITTTIE